MKDRIDKFYRGLIVNKFQFLGDLVTKYIGKTKRQLFVRIKEHIRPTNSAVFSHIEQCKICQNHNSTFNYFDVINFCKNRNTYRKYQQ